MIQVHFMSGVSDITLPKPLSTQDKHICCMVIAAKKKKEREKVLCSCYHVHAVILFLLYLFCMLLPFIVRFPI